MGRCDLDEEEYSNDYYILETPTKNFYFHKECIKTCKFITGTIFETFLDKSNDKNNLFFLFDAKIINKLISFFRSGILYLDDSFNDINKMELSELFEYCANENYIWKDIAKQLKFGSMDELGEHYSTKSLKVIKYANFPSLIAYDETESTKRKLNVRNLVHIIFVEQNITEPLVSTNSCLNFDGFPEYIIYISYYNQLRRTYTDSMNYKNVTQLIKSLNDSNFEKIKEPMRIFVEENKNLNFLNRIEFIQNLVK